MGFTLLLRACGGEVRGRAGYYRIQFTLALFLPLASHQKGCWEELHAFENRY